MKNDSEGNQFKQEWESPKIVVITTDQIEFGGFDGVDGGLQSS